MIKSTLLFLIIFIPLFYLSLNIHQNYLDILNVILPFSLKKVYLFHLVFSLLVCLNFKIFSTVDNILPQLGFIYLVSLILKIILFALIFYQPIFKEENLFIEARISLIIPMALFLFIEVFFVLKIINKNYHK